MKIIWPLGLLCLACAAPVRKNSKTDDKTAPQEEVNVLVFGLIQFSESLNYVYENTEAKIAKISKTLKNHEGILQKLEQETEQVAEAEKDIKQVIQLLQVQMAEQRAQTQMTKDWLASVEQEEEELETKVEKLEMHLNNSEPTSVKELQRRAQEHSEVLRDLKDFIQYQKENIDLQHDQLSNLQKLTDSME